MANFRDLEATVIEVGVNSDLLDSSPDTLTLFLRNDVVDGRDVVSSHPTYKHHQNPNNHSSTPEYKA